MIPERVTWWLAGTTAEQCYASSFTVLRPGENRYAITVALQNGGGKPKNYILKRRVPSCARPSYAFLRLRQRTGFAYTRRTSTVPCKIRPLDSQKWTKSRSNIRATDCAARPDRHIARSHRTTCNT